MIRYGILLKRLIGCRWITRVFVVIYFVMYKCALYLIYIYICQLLGLNFDNVTPLINIYSRT